MHVRFAFDTPLSYFKVAKGVNVQFPQQDFVANASHARLPQLTNQTKGSVFMYFLPAPSYLLACAHPNELLLVYLL